MRGLCVNADRIYQARLKAGMSQADVAYAIRAHGHKANERSIRRWETGEHAPHANVVPALAEALGVSIESLYERNGSDDEEEDEAVLRRVAHTLVDQHMHEMAADLLRICASLTSKRARDEAEA